MEKAHPGRIILLLIAVFVVGVSAFLISNREGGEEVFEKGVTKTDDGLSILSNIDTEIDSDGDGLKDWQEALWQTDKNNPDTDGDGTSDGEEVANNRNPSVAGPDDNIEINSTNTTPDSNTLTAEFSRDFFAQYLALKDSGVDINQNTEEFADKILDSNYLSVPVIEHTGESLTINSSLSLEEYAQNMGNLFQEHTLSPEKEESAVLGRYLNNANPEILDELDNPIRNYTSLRDSLLIMEVSPEISSIHLEFLNSIETIRSSLVSIKELGNDPLLGVLGISIYSDGVKVGIDAISKARSLYQEKGISFEQGEAGYIFLYGL